MALQLEIPSLSCGGCVRAVTQVVQTLDPQAKVKVDLVTKTMQVETALTASVLSKALAQAGYPTL